MVQIWLLVALSILLLFQGMVLLALWYRLSLLTRAAALGPHLGEGGLTDRSLNAELDVIDDLFDTANGSLRKLMGLSAEIPCVEEMADALRVVAAAREALYDLMSAQQKVRAYAPRRTSLIAKGDRLVDELNGATRRISDAVMDLARLRVKYEAMRERPKPNKQAVKDAYIECLVQTESVQQECNDRAETFASLVESLVDPIAAIHFDLQQLPELVPSRAAPSPQTPVSDLPKRTELPEVE